MVLKKTPSVKSKLMSWFFNKPAKFAILFFGLLLGLALVYTSARTLIYGDSPMSSTPVIVLLGAILIFSAYKLIAWLPKDNLDRRSFVAVNNGLTFIYFLSFFLSTVLLITSGQQIMYYMMWLQYYSMALFFVTMIAASLAYLYVLGLLIANIYAVYRRALSMGIPKWKVLLSFPFTFMLLWIPGYMLPEKTSEKPVVSIKCKWFASLTDWIIANSVNTVLFVTFILLFSALFMNLYISILTLLFAAVFGVWVLIQGSAGFRKSIGGAFTTFAASLNIALIITAIGFFSMGYNQSKKINVQIDAVEVIQPTDAGPESVK